MRRLTENVFVQTGPRGSNHGIVTTTDGIVLIDGPHKPSDTLRLKAEIARRGPLRYILNTEPHGDHWTSNALDAANLYDYVTGAGIHRRA